MRYHIDTHVHVYHCYEAEKFLAQAVRNSDASDPAAKLILCLTESSGFNFFQELKNNASTNTLVAGWSISGVPGQPAVVLNKPDQHIIIIAGRQIITQQGLEVIALFHNLQYDDGEETQIVIDKINQDNGIAVLPWGVGKWLGKRGAIITDLLKANRPDKLAIADISARPSLWPDPEQFSLAKKSGYNCLYGTDPLPLNHDQLRIAGAGMILDLPSDPVQAVADLKNILIEQLPEKIFGKRVSTLRFLKDQLMLRINKNECLSRR